MVGSGVGGGRLDFDMNANGAGMAVWLVGTDLVAHRYTHGTGWGASAMLDSAARGDPRVAIDAAGHAIAIWPHEDDATHTRMWARRFDAENGWGSSVVVDRGPAVRAAPKFDGLPGAIALDDAGNALVLGWKDREPWVNRLGPVTI